MKYAFNTWVYGSFPVWLPSYPLDEVIHRLANIGYDGIEIGCAAPHAWPAYLSPDRRKALRRSLEQANLTPVSLLPAPGGGPGCNPASPLPEEREWTVNHYKEVVDLAADLEAGIVLFIGGWQVFGTSRAEAWQWSLECLQKVAAYAEGHGIIVAVEPTSADSNIIESADDALELMQASDKANVKVMFDTFHVLYRNEVNADYVRAMGSSLVHIHAADSDRLPPGEGVVDWLGVMKALKAINYQGFISMEIGFNSRAADPDRYARSALSYLRNLESQL